MLSTTRLLALLLLLPFTQAGLDFHAAGTFFRRSPGNIHRRVRAARELKPRKTFTVADKFEGNDFFNDFTFNTFDDPTHGSVNYLSQDDAQNAGLAYVDNGAVVMAVDSKTKLGVGANRNSVRVTSNKAYTHALVIADISHMPTGCSTWPAFWLVGPDWPSHGEIDIIENVNNAATNQMTLHTGPGCTLNPSGHSSSPSAPSSSGDDGDDGDSSSSTSSSASSTASASPSASSASASSTPDGDDGDDDGDGDGASSSSSSSSFTPSASSTPSISSPDSYSNYTTPNRRSASTSPVGAIQAFSGNVLVTECESSGASNLGCSIGDPSSQSYGQGFNSIGGGVYATLWDSTGIYIYFFPRSGIPDDINDGNPEPSGWGTPVGFWSADSCDMDSHFSQMQIVFDITLCGDWAGATYGSSGCPGSCASAVADPSNFADARWEVNYVHVYQ